MNRFWPLAIAVSTFGCGVAAAPNQGPPLSRVMRDKLVHAQKIREAVVTSDWTSLDTHSHALERLTSDPAWAVLKFPEYATQSVAFVRAVQDLQRAATQRDAEKAPQAYVAVTLTWSATDTSRVRGWPNEPCEERPSDRALGCGWCPGSTGTVMRER
jgi:hypothetical protein